MDPQSISTASSKPEEDWPSPSSPEDPPPDPVEYVCKICSKIYYTVQALSAHQKAHKTKRAAEKTLPESTDLLLGWAAPDPRSIPPGQRKKVDLNLRLSSMPAYPDLSGFAAAGEDEQQGDDSEIELSLKL